MMRILPEGFARLEPFVHRWALSGSAARAERRGASSREEREAFYEEGRALLGDALDHLDARGLHALDAADEKLMNLLLSLAHVSLAVELQKDSEAGHAELRQFMRITRSPAGV